MKDYHFRNKRNPANKQMKNRIIKFPNSNKSPQFPP